MGRRRSRFYWVDITGQRVYAKDWADGPSVADTVAADPVG